MLPDDTTSVVRVPLRARDRTIRAYALIDAADEVLVNAHPWHASPDGYVRACIRIDGRYRSVLLHRFLLGLTKDDPREVDHINRDRLDNRRANFRVISKMGNRQNLTKWSSPTSSRFRGVSWEKRRQRWLAVVWTNGRRYQIGRFRDEDEAAEAVRQARLRLMPYALD